MLTSGSLEHHCVEHILQSEVNPVTLNRPAGNNVFLDGS